MKTLEEWKDVIKTEVPYIDLKPFSHNIISISLQAIAKDYGKNEANKAIEEFGLEELGWHKVN